MPAYSPAVERAIQVCLEAHNGQFRKGETRVPYAVHPLHMGLYLMRLGAGDEIVQAALLHDVVEDCEAWSEERLRGEFGDSVAEIVVDLTEDKSKSWSQRKQWAVDHIPSMSDASVIVKAADKLHNLESLAQQLGRVESKDAVWAHFTGGREQTLAMDRRLVGALAEKVGGRLAVELEQAFAKVERLA